MKTYLTLKTELLVGADTLIRGMELFRVLYVILQVIMLAWAYICVTNVIKNFRYETPHKES